MVCCPCALGLAAPLRAGHRHRPRRGAGILLRDPRALERLGAHPRTRVFDKTGTLTEGRMRVVAWTWIEDDPAPRRDIAAAHRGRGGRAQAIRRRGHRRAPGCADRGHPAGSRTGRETARGGVVGLARSAARLVELRVGSAAFTGCRRRGGDADDASSTSPSTASRRAHPPRRPPPRGRAPPWSRVARGQGWTVHVLSGDRRRPGRAVAAAVGIRRSPPARLSPEDKAAHVAASADCLVIGDGTNDARGDAPRRPSPSACAAASRRRSTAAMRSSSARPSATAPPRWPS